MIKRCDYCGKAFIRKGRQKFCDDKCKHKYLYKNNPEYKRKKKLYSMRTYIRKKDNPEYKRDKKLYFDYYRRKNRVKWNAQMSIISWEYQKRRRIKRNKEGLCLGCGKKRDDNYLNCSDCRLKKNYG